MKTGWVILLVFGALVVGFFLGSAYRNEVNRANFDNEYERESERRAIQQEIEDEENKKWWEF